MTRALFLLGVVCQRREGGKELNLSARPSPHFLTSKGEEEREKKGGGEGETTERVILCSKASE